MNGVHKDALAKAVKDGVITQQQADRMLQMMQAMYQNGYGPGNCPMYNGQASPFGRGRGVGLGMTPAPGAGAGVGGRGAGYGSGMMRNWWGTQTP